jgi:hypothetical protein
VAVVPGVDLPLQLVAPRQQGSVSRAEGPHELCKSMPKRPFFDARAGHGFKIDEIVQDLVDFEVIDADSRSHSRIPRELVKFAT